MFQLVSSDSTNFYPHPKQSDNNNNNNPQDAENFLVKAPMLSRVTVLLN